MIEFLKSDDKTIMAITYGVITRKDILQLEEVFKIKSQKSEKVNFYCECRDFIDITISAFLEDLLFKIRNICKIGRIAIVSNNQEAINSARLKIKLLGKDFKVFSLSDHEQAKQWVTLRNAISS